jgi:DNA-binding IclR family transcriptional regulator
LTARGKRPPAGDPVIERAFALLAAFDADHRRLTLSELSDRTGTPLSSTYRLAEQLIQCGALERDDSGRLSIGVRLYEMASLAPRSHGLREVALPYMGDLAEATREHVLLAVLDGDSALLVERLSGHKAMRVLYRVGGRMPLHSTAVGQVLLAFSPPAFQEEYLQRPLSYQPEQKTMSTDELRHALANARQERAVVVRRNPAPEATLAVATPIFGAGRSPVAALSLVVPDGSVDAQRLILALQTTALAISREMGAERRARPSP